MRVRGALIFWPWDALWQYVNAGTDPLDILQDERNLYAIERAEYLGRQQLKNIFYNGGDE